MNFAVIGLGYGDEGKGVVVDHLCSSNKIDYVVRFSGGHQVGHTVHDRESNTSHVFSNFGSGSYRNVPTYWSKYCTVDFTGIKNEHEDLKKKGMKPVLILDPDCPVTTVFDKIANEQTALSGHGTIGVGFGNTIQREEDNYHLRVIDFVYLPYSMLWKKIKIIREYYTAKHGISVFHDSVIESVIQTAYHVLLLDGIKVNTIDLSDAGNHVFEGSQGLLLSKNIGFFPHVTRSFTDSTNIFKLVGHPFVEHVNYHLVTRAYATRHGNGPFSENSSIPDNPYESNKDNFYQGKFKKGILDTAMLKYAIVKDKNIAVAKKTLVVTCMDIIENLEYPLKNKDGNVFVNGNEESFINKITRNVIDFELFGSKIVKVKTNNSPFSDTVKQFN